MGEPTAFRPWWDDLKLNKATAQLVAGRDPDSPAILAEDLRRFPGTFGPEARADLARAVAVHLGDGPKDAAGFQDLAEALEEAAGKRPAKALPEVKLSFGLAEDPNPVRKAPPPPVPRNLPKLKPRGPGKPSS